MSRISGQDPANLSCAKAEDDAMQRKHSHVVIYKEP
jgi:hypothetical protein